MHWDYWRLLTLVSLAGFIGLLFGHMSAFMFVAAFVYALWLQRSWYQLWHWLQKPKQNPSPSADGVIDDVCRQIDTIRLQNRLRKRKLADYLKRFQAATSALPDAIIVIGENGEVEGANTAARHVLGVHWPQDSQLRLTNIIRDPAFQNLMDSPTNREQLVIVKSPLNPRVQLEIKVVSYMGNGRMVIARDMTQTVKLQQMRRDFVANVSHELRTPLTVLSGYLGMFNEDTPPALWNEALPIMQQQSERMQAMITDLLALSQLETGEKPLRHIAVKIDDLFTSLVQDAKRLEHYQDHAISVEIESDLCILGDRDELHSALSNLLFNAIKYTPSGTQITLGWRINGNNAELYVIDQGEGIPEHHLERLTERFYRVDGSRAQETGGTGLGLAIVKHVLERHEAELVIQSELGAGSQFCCVFPKMRAVQAVEFKDDYA